MNDECNAVLFVCCAENSSFWKNKEEEKEREERTSGMPNKTFNLAFTSCKHLLACVTRVAGYATASKLLIVSWLCSHSPCNCGIEISWHFAPKRNTLFKVYKK